MPAELSAVLSPPALRRRRRVIAFLVVAALAVGGVVAAVLVEQDLFRKTIRLNFVAPSAHGITRGMAVKTLGFRIGAVEDVTLEASVQDETRVRVLVSMLVDARYASLIGFDARVRLAREGMIGENVVEIDRGNPRRSRIANHAMLEFDRSRDITDIAQDIGSQLKPILEDVGKVAAMLRASEGDFRAILTNVNAASAQAAQASTTIAEFARTMGARTESLQLRVERNLDRTQATLEKAGETLDTLNRTLATVDARLPGILLKAETGLANVAQATERLGRLADRLAEDVPTAIEDGAALVRDGREITESARRAWPLRTLVPEPVSRPVPLDSYPAAPAAR